MTVLGLILLLVWGYSVVSLAWELFTGTYEGNGLRATITLLGIILIIPYGIVEGWFNFLFYKIF